MPSRDRAKRLGGAHRKRDFGRVSVLRQRRRMQLQSGCHAFQGTGSRSRSQLDDQGAFCVGGQHDHRTWRSYWHAGQDLSRMKRNRAIFPGYVHRSIRSAPQAPRRTMCLAPDFRGGLFALRVAGFIVKLSPNRRQVLPGEYCPLGTKKRFVSGSRAHPFACLR
jgi:hypothetical protein